MPPVGTTPIRGWRRVTAIVLIASFVAVVAMGLCVTYGWVPL